MAGTVLAIILGSIFSGLIIIFLVFGLWLWSRIKKTRRLEAEEAARARAEGRASADTVVEGRDNELQVVGHQGQGKEPGVGATTTETTHAAV